MTRALRIVRAGPGVLDALRTALSGGPAILVTSDGARPEDVPGTVSLRTALVVESSGSTGRPKRIALGADAVLANAAASESALGGPGQWVLALPTHYVAGLNVLARSIAAGTIPVAVAEGPFTAAAFLAAAERLDAPDRFVSLVPSQLATLVADPSARVALARFAAVLVGGQATPATLLAEAADHGIRVVRSYGSSETSGGCVYDGRPNGTTEVRIRDGEVQLAGPTLAEGYLGDPALTEERFIHDEGLRWFRTADAGYLTEEPEPRLVVTGRRDDVIISGGVKVALGAIEQAVRELPGLSDAVIVGAPDSRWGEVPVLVSVHDADLAAVRAAVESVLGPAARPARVLRLAELPLLPGGKPDRLALRALVFADSA
ncbi:AMP-binding protein [uncultured Schumannella sp.]|uniref:AMP-binding protein n=1 Tax=uncultured Schumannella sp. TaxID=1195956 RepID=UPI0025FAF77D|nr:AMP-binding protein [uncultured Schumannella sp.]